VRESVEEERYSLPFFYNPSYDTIVQPLVGAEKGDYVPIRWGDFWKMRVIGNIIDVGEEIQIEEFKNNNDEL
jgi:isopenicillin N synthase-like dioxygenase